MHFLFIESVLFSFIHTLKVNLMPLAKENQAYSRIPVYGALYKNEFNSGHGWQKSHSHASATRYRA